MRRITWIVVAQAAEARIFEHRKIGSHLSLLRSFTNPEGRLKNQDIVSDRQGSSRESGRVTPHSFSPEVDPATKLLEHFIKDFLGNVEQAAYKNEFDHLVLAATPRLLGMMQNNLGAHSKSKLAATLNKDLSHAAETEVAKQIGTVMQI